MQAEEVEKKIDKLVRDNEDLIRPTVAFVTFSYEKSLNKSLCNHEKFQDCHYKFHLKNYGMTDEIKGDDQDGKDLYHTLHLDPAP